ncbi:Fur family transcriptional regulator [Belliella marina]|uniref:Fur family transcriptional regulator n=1 Tax=Belliella marina TaxID=1644146 RepID=A0ABW4VLH0_9BACT
MDNYALILKEKGIRPNKNRIAVLQKLAEEGKAFSLCTMSGQMLSQMNRTTVYRTLMLFTEKKLICKIPCSDGNTLYTLQTNDLGCINPAQFRCKSCQKVEALPNLPEEYLNEIRDKKISFQSVILEGFCEECGSS